MFDHEYIRHKMYTVAMQLSGFSVAFITTLVEELDTWARVSGAVAALCIAIGAAARTYWEVKIKKIEHDIAQKEKEVQDQILWREVAINKKQHANNNSESNIKIE